MGDIIRESSWESVCVVRLGMFNFVYISGTGLTLYSWKMVFCISLFLLLSPFPHFLLLGVGVRIDNELAIKYE